MLFALLVAGHAVAIHRRGYAHYGPDGIDRSRQPRLFRSMLMAHVAAIPVLVGLAAMQIAAQFG